MKCPGNYCTQQAMTLFPQVEIGVDAQDTGAKYVVGGAKTWDLGEALIIVSLYAVVALSSTNNIQVRNQYIVDTKNSK